MTVQPIALSEADARRLTRGAAMTAPVLFQFMPPLLPSEYQALTESIRTHGVQVPVVVDENGAIIDGHHRDQIAAELGVTCPRIIREDLTDAEKRTLAISLNKDRRHLTREQVRALVAESLKADPHLSDRAHAQRVGVSPSTVGAVRSQVSNLDTSPAERIDSLTGEVIESGTYPQARRAPWPERHDEPTVEQRVTGLDGKSYTRPEPRTPRRRAITDQARDAGWDLLKSVERLERIADDDRFTPNKDQVAAHLRGHLQNAIRVCQDLLDRIDSNEGNLS